MRAKWMIGLWLSCLPAEAQDSLIVMFWNLENFFDCKDGSSSASDHEFSSAGDRHWTKKRFHAKCSAVGKSILWVGSRYGRLPDVIGLAEVENRYVLQELLRTAPLQKTDYGIVHYDSPDPRGIDVALLYRRSVFEVLSSRPCRLTDTSGVPLRTRDILLVQLQGRSGFSAALLVNHHPSKYGGAKESEGKRRLAVRRLKALGDSLTASGTRHLIAAGDFNDSAGNALFEELSPPFENKSLPLYRAGEGTIRFDGKWELIDMFFVSGSLSECSEMEIVQIPYLMTRDGRHSGEKPLRTYSGPVYLGGVSDHCPIVLHIRSFPE